MIIRFYSMKAEKTINKNRKEKAYKFEKKKKELMCIHLFGKYA